FRKTLRGLLGFDLGFEPILVLINVDTADLLDGLLYSRHSSLRSRLQGPRGGFVGYGARAISVRWFPWLMVSRFGRLRRQCRFSPSVVFLQGHSKLQGNDLRQLPWWSNPG